MGADEPQALISDREAPASQKWSYAVGAHEESDGGGTTGNPVPARVSAEWKACDPVGVFLGDMRK
jgi:hypothetical protein